MYTMGVGTSTKNWGAMQFSPRQWQSAFSLVTYTFASDTQMSQEAKMLVYCWSTATDITQVISDPHEMRH